LKLTCLCGGVRIEIGARPTFLHDCNCTLCRKSGAWWAYLRPGQVEVAGETRGYSRADTADPSAELRFCATCGATTHYVLTPSAVARYGNVQMGVNLRLAAEADLAGIELRFPDGAAWDGAGEFAYVRAPHLVGGEHAQT
jgi:hypothetical protein